MTGKANDFGNVPDELRCTYIKKDGERCKKPRMTGVTICNTPRHGASLPSVRNKSRLAKESAMQARRGVPAIGDSDPEGRGDVALQVEIRRTIGWIRYCEERIADLGGPEPRRGDPEDLSAADAVLAAELGGVQLSGLETTSGVERDMETNLRTEKWSTGVNVWEEKLRWNRAHLVTLTKQWIAAGFEAKRLELQQRTLDMLEKAIDGIVRDLGHNPRDIQVRTIVKTRLAELDGG